MPAAWGWTDAGEVMAEVLPGDKAQTVRALQQGVMARTERLPWWATA